MSTSSTTAATAARATTQWKYHVFLNFRGDIRWGFVGHLKKSLNRAKIVTFIDENMRKGEEISPALLEAIEDSKVAVAIFSKGYASSTCCLDELVKIIESWECRGQTVIPVFYDVVASVVQEQSEPYAEAFAKHEKDPKNTRRVPVWKHAMTKAAKIAGIEAQKTRTEAELVKEIVNEIQIILRGKSDSDGKTEGSNNAGSVSSSSELQAPIENGGMDREVKNEESKNAGSVSSSAELHTPIERPECRDDKNSHPRGNPPQGSQQGSAIPASSSKDGNGTQTCSDTDSDTSSIVYMINM